MYIGPTSWILKCIRVTYHAPGEEWKEGTRTRLKKIDKLTMDFNITLVIFIYSYTRLALYVTQRYTVTPPVSPV